MDIRTTERGDFMRCRRMWMFSSANGMNLEPFGPAAAALYVGTMIHNVLGMQSHGIPWREVLDDLTQHEISRYSRAYEERVGCKPSPSELDKFGQFYSLCESVLDGYFRQYGTENHLAPYKVLEIEYDFRVPIPGVEDGFLKGRMDAVVEDALGRLWVVDHKTTSGNFPSEFDLTWNDQFRHYVWALTKMQPDRTVAGVVYNGIRKKSPAIPARTTAGKISRAHIATTPEIYRKAVLANGEDPAEYADVLERLEKQQPFYKRMAIEYSPTDWKVLEDALRAIYYDMRDGIPYPNFRWEGCWDCSYQDLCYLVESGLPLEGGLSRYQQREGA